MLLHITMELDETTPLMTDSISLFDALNECFGGFEKINVIPINMGLADEIVVNVRGNMNNTFAYPTLKNVFGLICDDQQSRLEKKE